jgi:UDP-glucose 4-epimerase
MRLPPRERGPNLKAKLLVLGGEGFIGRNFCEVARAKGHEVISSDIAGTPQLRKAVEQLTAADLEPYDRIYDFSGSLGTAESFSTIGLFIENNILNSVHLFEICRRLNKSLVYLTLGNRWLNPYSITKNAAADFCRMFAREYRCEFQVAVTYNAFGPYQKWQPVRKIVPEFFTRLLSGRPIELFNNGSQPVDMVYARDLAEALLANHEAGTFYYGSGIARPVKQVAQDCADALGIEPEFVYLPRRVGENIEGGVVSESPMHPCTEYMTALRATAEWYRSNYRVDQECSNHSSDGDMNKVLQTATK